MPVCSHDQQVGRNLPGITDDLTLGIRGMRYGGNYVDAVLRRDSAIRSRYACPASTSAVEASGAVHLAGNAFLYVEEVQRRAMCLRHNGGMSHGKPVEAGVVERDQDAAVHRRRDLACSRLGQGNRFPPAAAFASGRLECDHPQQDQQRGAEGER